LVLSDLERLTLERVTNRRKSAQAMVLLRARIVLPCAKPGVSNLAVADRLRMSLATVGKWRARFVAKRLNGLFDEVRPGPPRTVPDDKVEGVVLPMQEERPADGTHSSTRSMAKSDGGVPDVDQLDLAGVRAAAALGREFQVVDRPALH
jgi:transposase